MEKSEEVAEERAETIHRAGEQAEDGPAKEPFLQDRHDDRRGCDLHKSNPWTCWRIRTTSSASSTAASATIIRNEAKKPTSASCQRRGLGAIPSALRPGTRSQRAVGQSRAIAAMSNPRWKNLRNGVSASHVKIPWSASQWPPQ